MAFQYARLRGKIVEKYKTQSAFAEALGTTIQTVSKKMNASVPFSHDDIVKWCELLDIHTEEIGSYFFE